MCSVCCFRYMLANSFFAFLSFRALILVEFFLLHLAAVFKSDCFFLTTNISHGTLGLALYLVGMLSAAASKWAPTKFSYSSLEICVSVFSCSASYLFLSVNAYLSLISLLLSRGQSTYVSVLFAYVLVHRFLSLFWNFILWHVNLFLA